MARVATPIYFQFKALVFLVSAKYTATMEVFVTPRHESINQAVSEGGSEPLARLCLTV